jgi:hypothetical protein
VIAELLRVWCRLFHSRDHLRPHLVGRGSLVCIRCGCTFADRVDAGLIEFMSVSVPRPGMEEPDEQFRPLTYRVLQGGRTVKVVRFRPGGMPVEWRAR